MKKKEKLYSWKYQNVTIYIGIWCFRCVGKTFQKFSTIGMHKNSSYHTFGCEISWLFSNVAAAMGSPSHRFFDWILAAKVSINERQKLNLIYLPIFGHTSADSTECVQPMESKTSKDNLKKGQTAHVGLQLLKFWEWLGVLNPEAILKFRKKCSRNVFGPHDCPGLKVTRTVVKLYFHKCLRKSSGLFRPDWIFFTISLKK